MAKSARPPPAVTDADISAAVSLKYALDDLGSTTWSARAAKPEEHPVAQAFARHRQAVLTATRAEALRAERDRAQQACEQMAAIIVTLREALEKSREGWENAVEFGIIPPKHRNAARILADEARAALAWAPSATRDAISKANAND